MRTPPRRGTSQPVASLLSQFKKLEETQLERTQLPVVQLALALSRLHGVAHAPQLLSVFSGSQPLESTLSQFSEPMLQVPIVHEPPAQTAVALLRVHAAPQPPQWARELFVSVSQPLPPGICRSPLQSTKVCVPEGGMHSQMP